MAKILYLSPTSSLGGAERVLLACMGAVRRADPDADLHLLTLGDGPLLDHASRLAAKCHPLPPPRALAELGDSQAGHTGRLSRLWSLLGRSVTLAPAARRYLAEFRRAVAGVGPDLVHSHGIKTHLLAGWMGRSPAPVLWHVHDFYRLRSLAGRLLRWARGPAGAVAISPAVADDFAAAVPGVPVHLVPNAVDTEKFVPGPADPGGLDALAGLPPAPPGTLRVGLVATYARWKGQDVFLQAAARLVREDPNLPARFYVVGGPIYQTRGSQFSADELRALAVRLGLAGRVGFVGFLPDPLPAYRSLDVVAHASTRPEPFGLTIAEAMACGRAVIVAAAGGAAGLFRHGVSGHGVPPGDAAALAEAIGKLARDSAYRNALGEHARRHAEGEFGLEPFGERLLAAYWSVGNHLDFGTFRTGCGPGDRPGPRPSPFTERSYA